MAAWTKLAPSDFPFMPSSFLAVSEWIRENPMNPQVAAVAARELADSSTQEGHAEVPVTALRSPPRS